MTIKQQFQGFTSHSHGLGKVYKGYRVVSAHSAISVAQTQLSPQQHSWLLRWTVTLQILGWRWRNGWMDGDTSTAMWRLFDDTVLWDAEKHTSLGCTTKGGERRGSIVSSDRTCQTAALKPATVQLMLRRLSLGPLSSPPNETIEWKRIKVPAPYEILPNPHGAPWPSHSYLKISFENNLSNKW